MIRIYCDLCGFKDFELIGEKEYKSIITKKKIFDFKVRLFCCRNCGLLFQNPLQNMGLLEEYYSTMFREENFRPQKVQIRNSLPRVEFASNFLKQGDKVLEIGCADGTTLELFKSKGFIPFGIEPSEKNSAICKKKKIEVFKCFYEKYPIENYEKYDLICSYFVLEHITSPVDFLSFCNRLLDLDKFICMEVPDIEAYNKEEGPSDMLFFFEHQYHFTKDVIEILLQRCGFKLIKFAQTSSTPFGMHFVAKKISQPINPEKLILKPNIFKKVMTSVKKEMSNYENRAKVLRHKIAEIFSDKFIDNVVIFGAGSHTKELLKYPEIKNITFRYIVDNDKDKWGLTFCNLKVYSPDKIDNQINRIIISSHSFEKEIFDQLIDMGIDKDKIIKFYS